MSLNEVLMLLAILSSIGLLIGGTLAMAWAVMRFRR